MFKLQLKNDTDRYVMLTSGLVTIGRDPTNHFVITAADISDFHAEVVYESDTVTVVDLLSGSGTFVNEKRIMGRQKLVAWDVIRLGSVEFELNDPSTPRPQTWTLQLTQLPAHPSLQNSSKQSQRFSLEPVSVIGRDASCTLCLDSDLLSRRHVELSIVEDRVRIRDLGSANGTYLNDRRITDGWAEPGDQIRIDPYTFTLVGPENDEDPDSTDATQLKDDPTLYLADQAAGEATELTPEHHHVATLTERAESGIFLLQQPKVLLSERPYGIGRLANNDIVVPDKGVSKLHAQLSPHDGHWIVQDLGSSNGVQVNGATVQRTRLESGDEIKLGRATFVFELMTR